MKIKQCPSQIWEFWKWLIKQSCQECLALTRCLVWVSDQILEIQVVGWSLSFSSPDLNLNFLRSKSVEVEVGVFQRRTCTAVLSDVTWLVEGEHVFQHSLQHPRTVEATVILGITCSWEDIYVWVIIQFMHIYALTCDMLSYLLVYYLLISTNHMLSYDSLYLKCNTF